jgi:hypothetical protein
MFFITTGKIFAAGKPLPITGKDADLAALSSFQDMNHRGSFGRWRGREG